MYTVHPELGGAFKTFERAIRAVASRPSAADHHGSFAFLSEFVCQVLLFLLCLAGWQVFYHLRAKYVVNGREYLVALGVPLDCICVALRKVRFDKWCFIFGVFRYDDLELLAGL